MAEESCPVNANETPEDRAARYARALTAIANIAAFSSISAICKDVLEGYEATCPFCGDDIHRCACAQQCVTSYQLEKQAAKAVAKT
jgi:hypothetical protein